jgi:hypothetical protein
VAVEAPSRDGAAAESPPPSPCVALPGDAPIVKRLLAPPSMELEGPLGGQIIDGVYDVVEDVSACRPAPDVRITVRFQGGTISGVRTDLGTGAVDSFSGTYVVVEQGLRLATTVGCGTIFPNLSPYYTATADELRFVSPAETVIARRRGADGRPAQRPDAGAGDATACPAPSQADGGADLAPDVVDNGADAGSAPDSGGCAVAPNANSGTSLPLGAKCGTNEACAAGLCVDGVCCSTPCDGACRSCNVPGKNPGTCVAVTAAVDLDTCAGGRVCSSSGTCLAADGASCTDASQCALGFCTGGRCCASADCKMTVGWTVTIPGVAADMGGGYIWAVSVARDGDVYAVGGAWGPDGADEDPSPACVAAAPPNSFVVLKLDPDGRYLWSRALTYVPQSSSISPLLAVATADGGVVVAGGFVGSIDFDPTATQEIHDGGTGRNFLTKYAADGTYLWTRTFGSDLSAPEPHALVAMPDGGVLMSGFLVGTVDLDPGPGEDLYVAAPDSGGYVAYVLKLNANGDHVWAATFPSSGESVAGGLAVASDGTTALAFEGVGTLDVDPGPGTMLVNVQPASSSNFGGVVVLLDAQGAYLWHSTLPAAAEAVAFAGDATVITAGDFKGTANFGPDGNPVSLTATSPAGVYVAALSRNDGAFQWARSFDSYNFAAPPKLLAGPASSIFVKAMGDRPIDLDPGPGVVPFNPGSANDYIVQLSGAGDYLWSITGANAAFRDMAGGPGTPFVIGGAPVTPSNIGSIEKWWP